MSFLKKIKIFLVLIFFIAIGGFSMLFQARTRQRDKAVSERDAAKEDLKVTQKRIEAHEKRQQIEDDIALGDIPDVSGMRDPYARDD